MYCSKFITILKILYVVLLLIFTYIHIYLFIDVTERNMCRVGMIPSVEERDKKAMHEQEKQQNSKKSYDSLLKISI